MGIIGTMEKRMAMGPTSDLWYQPGGFFYGGTGAKTKSGSQVSEFNAMQLTVVWACIKMLAEDSASLPLDLFRRRKSGSGKDKAYADDRYFLMHDQPNPEMTAMSFRESYASHLLSWGNGYAEKEMRGSTQKLQALWLITPNRVTVKRDESKRIKYHIAMGGQASPIVFDKSRVLHTPGLSFNGLIGYSPIAAAREAIGLGLALEEYGELYFGNGTHPGVVVTHPGSLSPQSYQNMTQALTDAHSGLGKAHRLLLLEENMKIEKIVVPNNDAQFIESKKYTNIDIGTRIYRFPPQMYGEFDKASTYASAEQFDSDYVTKTLRPWLVRLEQSYNMNLLDPSERGEYFFEHNMEGLIRGDIKARYEAYVLGKRNGWLNADEIREKENFNPIPDGQGQEYIVEKNMIGLSDLGNDVKSAAMT